MIFCKKCGAELEQDAKFCNVCGETVEAAQSTPQPENVQANAAPQYDYQYTLAQAPAAEKGKSWQGITSLICGIVGFICCISFIPSILALVFGFMGLKSKKTLSIIGIVLGCLGLLIGICVVIFYASHWDQIIQQIKDNGQYQYNFNN